MRDLGTHANFRNLSLQIHVGGSLSCCQAWEKCLNAKSELSCAVVVSYAMGENGWCKTHTNTKQHCYCVRQMMKLHALMLTGVGSLNVTDRTDECCFEVRRGEVVSRQRASLLICCNIVPL